MRLRNSVLNLRYRHLILQVHAILAIDVARLSQSDDAANDRSGNGIGEREKSNGYIKPISVIDHEGELSMSMPDFIPNNTIAPMMKSTARMNKPAREAMEESQPVNC